MNRMQQLESARKDQEVPGGKTVSKKHFRARMTGENDDAGWGDPVGFFVSFSAKKPPAEPVRYKRTSDTRHLL